MASEETAEKTATGQTEAGKTGLLLDPNDFQLRGDGVTISYSTTSISGKPLFHYKDAKHDVNASGDQISTQDSPVGGLVTITLEIHPDVSDVRLTLVVPKIKLHPNEKVTFATIAIETTDRSQSFVAPPGPSGVLQTYRVHNLRGTAQHLIF